MEIKEENLISLSKEEKIERLKYENNYYYVKILIMSLQSDELKLQMIEKLQDNDKNNLVKSLQSDDLKLNYIRNVEQDDYKKADIAKSIKSDELKIQALSLVEEDYNKRAIIITMQADEKKIEAMKKHIKKPYQYVDIIESFSSIENKIANLNLLDDLNDKEKVLRNIKPENDEQRLNIAILVEDDLIAMTYIKEIEDDEKKIQAIELLILEEYKKYVILTLNEKRRLSLLEQIKNSRIQDEIITSITDDSVKVEYLHYISDENLKCKVLISLESDEQKLTQLQQLKLENKNFSSVIASLKSDEEKLVQLKGITDSKNIVLIKMSLTDREKLKEAFLDKNRSYLEIGLDKNMTIGMEIEAEGEMSSQIQKLKKIAQRQVVGEIRYWETKEDITIEEGVEVVSPILNDNKEDVEEIYMICSMLQKCGLYTNERCGGHIHIGADYLKSKESYINLFEIWGNTEKIICKMSNEIGTIPRIGLQEYACSISPKLNEVIESETINLENEEDLEQFISEIQEVQKDKCFGLNLLNINNGKNTIEFRVSNGTINPDTWIENARLYGRIVQISQKLAEIEKQSKRSKEEERLLDLKQQLKEEIPEQEKMEILLEILFSEEEKKVYRERYISNSKLLEQIPKERNPFQKAKFNRVDFKKKKHSLNEFREVAINNTIEATNEETRETVQGIKTEGELEQIYDSK